MPPRAGTLQIHWAESDDVHINAAGTIPGRPADGRRVEATEQQLPANENARTQILANRSSAKPSKVFIFWYNDDPAYVWIYQNGIKKFEGYHG